jgi:membrane-bound lytic murein transglycosylase MltF
MRASIFLVALFAAPALAQPVALDADLEPWLGDFDGMLERRVVRVLVPYSRTLFFNDKGAQRGLTADALKDFETFLNRKHKLKNRPITVVAVPTTRDRLLPALVEGRGDIAAGNLTITAERGTIVDFSQPVFEGVSEIVVTGPASPPLATLDDLAGQEVHVRRASTYHASLTALNQKFSSEKKAAMRLTLVPDALEDEDLMDMLAAGLVKLVVVDDWKASLWSGMVPKLKPRRDLALSHGENVGWAFRKASPKLAAEVNHYIRTHPGAAAKRFKNYPRYLKQLRNATADADWKRFEKTLALFQKYGARYQFDYLMLAAQGYQESRLNQEARSHVGAIGIMQVMPATGEDMRVGDITGRSQRARGRQVHALALHRHFDDAGMDGRTDALRDGGVQRRPGARRRAARRGSEEGARSQRLVQQRGADRRAPYRARNRDLRAQHLQVLHRLQAPARDAGSAPRSASAAARARRRGAQIQAQAQTQAQAQGNLALRSPRREATPSRPRRR